MHKKRSRGYRGSLVRPIGVGMFGVQSAAAAPLDAPANLSAEIGQQAQTPVVNLSWDAVAGATGYSIERSTDGGSGWAEATTSATNSKSNVAFTANDTQQRYRVRATGGGSPSDPSNVVGAYLFAEVENTTQFAFPVASVGQPANTVCIGNGGGNSEGGGALSLVQTTIASGDYSLTIPSFSYYQYPVEFSKGSVICSAANGSAAGGGQASEGVGSTKFSGGTGQVAVGGGGGGAAGKTGNGGNASAGAGGAAGTGGTLSGAGGNNGVAANYFGGGGGFGAAGRVGCIAITWREP